MSALTGQVEALLRVVAAEVVMPRFRNLAAADKEEKAPDDWVTIADREAELRLIDGLAAIDPGTRIVGEEGVAADPALLDGIGSGRLWLIDPIDGTGNFAAGNSPFGLMIALVEDGLPIEGWILDPVADRLCHARAGAGAAISGAQVRARRSERPRPVAALATYFMTEEQRRELSARADPVYECVDIPRCAAEQYPRLVIGQNDIAIFERTLPWDHAPGVLFLNEAGGRVTRMDGSPYRIGDTKRGLLGTSTPELWDEAARVLFG